MNIDVGELVKSVQERLSVLTHPDRIVGELIDLFRDTHRILLKLESTIDRLDDTTQRWDKKLDDIEVSPERLDRLEQALFNIERATLRVEASLGALPKALRSRIVQRQRPGAGDTAPSRNPPYPV
jgi:DNA repair ATPase RecN